MSRRTPWRVILLSALLLASGVSAQEVLTNDAVITMKKAGLSDAIILAKIRGSQSKFDLSTKALVQLKEAGLSDQVIEAMLAPGAPTMSPPVAPATTTAPIIPGPDPRGRMVTAAPQTRESIFHVRGDQYIELTAAFASIESSFAVWASKSEIVLKGRKAAYRIVERQPVFVSVWPPNEAPLVRLKPGDDHDDRNLKFSSGSFIPWGGSQKQGVRTRDVVDVDSEKDSRGFYRVKPRQPLMPGEYGFILTHGFAGSAGGGKIFDFGID